MTKLSKLLPACGFVVAVALVGITSSFKDAPKKGSADPTPYYYEYTGSQTVAERMEPSNYKNPHIASFECEGSGNECSVQVNVSTATPPTDISGLNVSYSPTTGFPLVGGDVISNVQQD